MENGIKPEQAPPQFDGDETNRIFARQMRIIEMLRDQVGRIVLANVEVAAENTELRDELAMVRQELAQLKPDTLAPPTFT